MKNQNVLFLGLLIVVQYSCKDELVDLQSKIRYDSKTYIRAYIDSDNRLNAYEYLDSCKNVKRKISIVYSKNLINLKFNDTLCKKYELNTDELIKSIIDSSNSNQDTLLKAIHYNNGTLKTLMHFDSKLNFYYNYLDSSSLLSYCISLAYINVELYDTVNIIDFIINSDRFYMNLLKLGNQNKKLLKHVKWGANSGPSTYPAESDYNYKLDRNGLVIEKIETYYPPHHLNIVLKEKDIKHYLTTYEYIKNYAP